MHQARALGLGMFALLLAGTTACSDTSGPGKAPADGLPALIVSSPLFGAASAAIASAGSPVAGSVVYVSLPPGTVLDGISATIQDQATGVAITTGVVTGGFDPVAVTANVGDTLTVTITRAGSAGPITGYQVVSLSRPPKVVRTSPPKGKADVPINAVIVVVFSAPIDSATLNSNSAQVLRGFTPVAGVVRLSDATGLRAEFLSDSLLAKLTHYQLVVTKAIRGVDGLALDSGVTVPFTTGALDQSKGLVFTMVSAGGEHSCGLVLSGAAYCWGDNYGENSGTARSPTAPRRSQSRAGSALPL